MGLPESFFTEYFHASDIRKRLPGEVKYSCPIEKYSVINFNIDNGYTGELLRIESLPTGNEIIITQSIGSITLEGITSVTGINSTPILQIDVLLNDTIGHLYINKEYIGSCELAGNYSQNLYIVGGLHYLKIWNSKISEDIIKRNYKYFLPEQFYWSFNGEDLGRTRCDITRHSESYDLSIQSEDIATGSSVANTGNVNLNNENPGYEGCFSDDQYADRFDPVFGFYNGTISDRFLQDRIGGYIESTFNNSFETQLIGRIDSSFFRRDKSISSKGVSKIKIEDKVEKIARTVVTDGLELEDYNLVDDDENNSILHTLVRYATNLEINNIITNGDFESGLTDWSGGSIGTDSFSGTSSASGTISRNINTPYGFYYVSFYAKGGSITASLGETSISKSTGSDWEIIQFKARTGQDVSTLVISGTNIDNVQVSTVATYGYIQGEFKTLEIVADEYKIKHPWLFVEPGESMWDYLKELSIASAGTYIGCDKYGRFIFESGFNERPIEKDVNLFRSVGAQIADSLANKMKVSGTYILKDEDTHAVWNTDSANFNSEDLEIAPGGLWPDPDVNGEYFARYKGIE
jgi:hypothetical protein